MRISLTILTIACLLFQTLKTLHYDYELSRGRKMWTGFQRAVHYFDHFTLLSQKLTNVKGLVTTNYSLHYQNEWSLTFELKKLGLTNSDKDGFMLLMSPQAIDAYEDDKDNKNKTPFLKIAVS